MKVFLIVKLALLPFIVLWVLLGWQQPAWAIWSALALSLLGNLWRAYRTELAVLELGGLALFVLLAIANDVAPNWTAANTLWLSFVGLALISFASLTVGRPWTADYSRASYADSAATPQFQLINMMMTGLWGVLFLVLGLCRWAGVSSWITTAIVVGGALISIFGPRFAISQAIQRMRAAREDYHWPAPAFSTRESTDCDVAVIGAGIGGLTAAALLAESGLKVKVFDHHVVPGGFCHSYLRKAHHDNKPVLYRFDAGPHDFSGVWPGGPVDSVLHRLGVADRIEWKRVTHSYRLAGRSIDVPEDWRAYVRLLSEMFPASADGLVKLFDTIHAIFESMYATGEGRSGIPGMPDTIEELLAFPRKHPQAFRWMNKPFDELVAAHVSDPELIAYLNALSGYLGDRSETLSCAQMVPIFGYYFKGGFYPVGGSGHLADVLTDAITARGGEVVLKSKVARILVEQDRAAGVELGNGRKIRAHAVVSNADLGRTFTELLSPADLPAAFRDRAATIAPATSCFSVHLGLDFVPDIAPATHLDAPMGVGLAVMSKLDPSAAPEGHATMTIITLVPHEQAKSWFPEEGGDDYKAWRRSPDYDARKQQLGDAMVAAAEAAIPGLSQHIVYRTDASPVTYSRYDLASAGSIYGVARSGRMKGAKAPLRNLVIAGGGNAGAGVEAVVISGAEAAEALVPGLLSRKAVTAPRPQPELALA
ncbi:Putative phytoene dehydrogenase and related proteins; putative membrane protein [Bradyrhizobium sp. ORS 278]|uniref:phytoene desaturase family protein n=1 Tax=Bradyrhizobium sp. (strain ORS 278) TaxID=114615 RepID=UPI0001507D88|nr:NAD(P)/FAD-dependent oxidoreductase [Bradyrhizobium sp. ORS 278]CAL74589.1 Putative phytoene dehydrogenase and related proteins; putative membrane protein [Bradyrhizobium sp. ORS 278]